jgi:molybdopterin biosynthesis enzyme
MATIMNFDIFDITNKKEVCGTLQPTGRYEYYLGTIDGRPVVVQSANPKLCYTTLKQFQLDAFRKHTKSSTQDRLRAKLLARTKTSE